MVVRNKVDRYHLVMDCINNAKVSPAGAHDLYQYCEAMLEKHAEYIVENLEDLPEVANWKLAAD
jgi:xylulose-5-phosphate/fructose-6-phosphate phosphoketolase